MRSTSASSIPAIYHKLYKTYGPQGWWPGNTRFEVIAGAILTQNTAWSNVEKAIFNLKKAGILSPEGMRVISEKRLASLIRPAGYYNIKAKRLKNFISFLSSRYGGNLSKMGKTSTERLRTELLSINGIGPETCDSILLYAFRRPVFVVDAYTKRIFSRHGSFREDAPYGTVQEYFMDRLPRSAKLYNEYHALIVRLAKDSCKKQPHCGECSIFTAVGEV